MTKQEFHKKYGFKLTDSHLHRNEEFGITPKIQDILWNELEKINAGQKAGMVKRIKSFITKYPTVPQFKNYLSVLYDQNGQLDLAFKNTQKTLEAHPNYLFAKVNLSKK